MDAAKELQDHIAKLRGEIANLATYQAANVHSPVRAAHLQAEILATASQLAEISTRRVEQLTKHLVCLTYVLAALTLGLLIFTIALYARH
jgi:hypothetical protein